MAIQLLNRRNMQRLNVAESFFEEIAEAEVFNTLSLDDNQIRDLVNGIIGSLGDAALDYEKAAKTYNIDFFRTETPALRKTLCAALIDQFPRFKNNYWIKAASGAFDVVGPPPETLNSLSLI